MISELTYSAACIIAAAHVRRVQIEGMDNARSPRTNTPAPSKVRRLSLLRVLLHRRLRLQISSC